MVATLLDLDDDGRVAKARVAVGSCAARAHRLPAVEAALAGQPFDPELLARVGDEQLGPLNPIDDIRGSADYRREAAVTLIRHSLSELLEETASWKRHSTRWQPARRKYVSPSRASP